MQSLRHLLHSHCEKSHIYPTQVAGGGGEALRGHEVLGYAKKI